MTNLQDTALSIAAIGIGATAAMDIWLLALKRLGVPSQKFGLLGRWIGHWPQGKWSHDAIAKVPPVKGEDVIGWSAHYAIGIGFAAILIAVSGPAWTKAPSAWPAVLIGIATVAAPLFIMQPALGAGIASSRTAKPALNILKSIANHGVFGLGLYAAAVVNAAARG